MNTNPKLGIKKDGGSLFVVCPCGADVPVIQDVNACVCGLKVDGSGWILGRLPKAAAPEDKCRQCGQPITDGQLVTGHSFPGIMGEHVHCPEATVTDFDFLTERATTVTKRHGVR